MPPIIAYQRWFSFSVPRFSLVDAMGVRSTHHTHRWRTIFIGGCLHD
ncbi:hypothetical protein CORMATOL_02235 [Corynebacterium matruchotii ATCC 33806]|uniref:Uncharacterized protein n=1 Tax=Corynebacterium matruchotii ATCC 33806 TaxID=566549 RepID=C0E5F7_9CORY|nr:hypothetical protein CORMATOL_02235 [Corynebacterium matruchotii ATCC 33806]